ncbi:MAG: 4-(cytidine 5'-diphospho)-2-C-methyl-D-erythritol kinase, partial [Actinomycetota bacterium]|nr:4-(cytidine 5'-diphospho)-2-C-methyl-D-erythritol kinase [Actinomycetota bacterium]
PRAELLALAAELGSDVPFCLVGGTAIGSGRGQHLTPVLGRGVYHWVVALADAGLSTPQVYGELDRMRRGREVAAPAVPGRLMNALRAGDPRAVGAALSNDLQVAALTLCPTVAATLDAGDAAGALGALVSGSGPTVVFLALDEDHAGDVGAALVDAGVCRLVQHVTGPVAGARVVG